MNKTKPDVVLNVFPDALWFVATYEVCKKMKIPYFIHMHDLWEENFPGKNEPYGKLARKYEKDIFRHAKKIFCMTDKQQEHYENKYRIKTELLPHCVPHKLLNSEIKFIPNERKEKFIIYSGNVSNVPTDSKSIA